MNNGSGNDSYTNRSSTSQPGMMGSGRDSSSHGGNGNRQMGGDSSSMNNQSYSNSRDMSPNSRNNGQDMNSNGRMNNGNNNRFSSDRQDLMAQIDESISKIDKQLDSMKNAPANENRNARKSREDGLKNVQDQRRQLTDQAYKVQRSSESDFRQVRRETNRIIDSVDDVMSKMGNDSNANK